MRTAVFVPPYHSLEWWYGRYNTVPVNRTAFVPVLPKRYGFLLPPAFNSEIRRAREKSVLAKRAKSRDPPADRAHREEIGRFAFAR